MPQTILQEQRDEFDERNDFLHFMLGMISLSQSVLNSFVAPDGVSSPSSEMPSSSSSANQPDSDPSIVPLLR